MLNIPKTIFALWTGDNPMPKGRQDALKSLRNTGLEVIFINSSNLNQIIQNSYPLHPAYHYLSAVHRADYLRAYLMHHHGGGYSDIKFTQSSWKNSYEKLCDSKILCVGYPEIGWRGVARVPNWRLYARLILRNKCLIGNCAYIFRPKSLFTSEWIRLVHIELDRLMPLLLKNPATHPEDYLNRIANGLTSKYPIKWTQILGNIFHPLCLRHYKEIDQTLPRPLFNESVDF